MVEKIHSNWKQELSAAQKKEGKIASNRWIQIATINKNNEPRLRTVVFRGWFKENSMLIFTDRRSEKVKDIMNNNKVEVLWLLTKSKSQFRFKGHANIVDDDLTYWNKLNKKAKSTWFWPDPGYEFNNKDFGKVIVHDLKPKNFLVFAIDIHTVELLKLEKPFHKRYIWEEKNKWFQKRINP